MFNIISTREKGFKERSMQQFLNSSSSWFITALLVAVLSGIPLFFILKRHKKRSFGLLLPPPEIPGLPVLGNLLQLKEKKPFKTFTKWAEEYGPIYSIKTGANKIVVLNSADVAKEAMVTKYSSISTRKLSKALTILTASKTMVATSDYNDFYKNAKRNLLTSTLGGSAQKRHRMHRDALIEAVSEQFRAHSNGDHASEPVEFRDIFQSQLFGLSMKQAVGEDVESIHVEELGRTVSRDEIFRILVEDQMNSAIEVDWRDFFPYLRWIPNKGFTEKIQRVHGNTMAVMKALVARQKQRFATGVEMNKSYLQHLLSEADFPLSEEQIMMLVWESIIEASDTVMVATEWAMYELSKHPQIQNNLLMEIRKVCGSEKLTEEKLSQMPYLSAVFHETLRLHSPAPVVPLRYVHEDTQLGGYFIQKGTQIAINIYGCNMDKKMWESPEEWRPERFLTGKDDAMELYKTMAFGAGRRACAGSLQAMLIACTAIGRMVQEFEWILMEGEEEGNSTDTFGLTNHKPHPLRAGIIPRSIGE